MWIYSWVFNSIPLVNILLLCQYWEVFATVALSHLSYGFPFAPLSVSQFVFRIAGVTGSYLYFSMNSRFVLSRSVRSCDGILMGIILNP